MMIMDIIQFLLLAAVTFTSPGMTQQQECEIGSFPHQQQFSLSDENIDFLVPNSTASELIGYLVIVPQLKFDCHGYITRWHARTWLDSGEIVIDNLIHDITFQLWRPNTTDDRLYSFVGSNTFQFIGTSLRAGLSQDRQYFNLTGSPTDDERLFFQPGDVVGWYIHTTIQSTDRPLTIVYRHVTSSASGPGLQRVDMYSRLITDTAYADTPPPCDVAICSSQNTLIPSVIPYVTVEYDSATPSNTLETGRIGPTHCMNISSLLPDCDPITSDASTSAPTPPDQTTPITNSETVSTQFEGNFATLTTTIIVSITCPLLITAALLAVTFMLIVYMRSRNSTQNVHDAANEAHTTTINLADNEAYRVIETKDASSIVTSENAAYERAATFSRLINEQNTYEII